MAAADFGGSVEKNMQDKCRVLYYPHFQPNPRWLLRILLLTDLVDRIVPEDADTEDSDGIKQTKRVRSQQSPSSFKS